MKKFATLTALAALGIALVAPAAAEEGHHHTVCLQ